MNSSKIAILLILIAFAGLLIYSFRVPLKEDVVSQDQITTDGTASTTQNIEVNKIEAILEDKSGKVIITDVTPKPGDLAQAAPSLNRQIKFPADLAADARALITEKMTGLVQDLKKDSTRVQSWIDLGVLRKIIQDYDGAREAWVYASLLSPGAIVPHQNLADLYTSYLKNFPKAEVEWGTVIRLDPKNSLAYRGLYDLYHLSYAEKAGQAIGVLFAGLKANPQDIDLMIPVAHHYRDAKDFVSARAAYERAIAEASRRADTRLEALLRSELSALK